MTTNIYWGTDAAGITATHFVPTPAFTPTLSGGQTYDYYLRIQTVDHAGNVSPWQTMFNFRYDNDPPLPPILSTAPGCPATNGIWQNLCDSPTFTWNDVGDEADPSPGYYVYWGDQASGTGTVSQTQRVYTSSISVPSGIAHYLNLQAEDDAGNMSATSTFTFLYDDETPQISNLTPVTDALITQSRPVISATLTDPAPGSGINTVSTTLVVDGQVVSAQVDPDEVSYVPVQDLADDIHYVTAQTSDLAGNAAQRNWQFEVDADTWLDIVYPAAPITLNIPQTRLELAFEPDPGGADVTVSTSGGVVTNTTSSSGQWQINALALQTGLNTITATVTDSADNVRSDTVQVTVDPAVPVALAQADPAVFNPANRDTVFFLTALPGSEQTIESWQLSIIDGAQTVITHTGTITMNNRPEFYWQGRDAFDQPLPDGEYTYQLVMTTTTNELTPTVTATASPLGTVRLLSGPPPQPTITCDPNPLYFTSPPATVQGTAPAPAEVVKIQTSEVVTSVVVPVVNEQWQSLVPLVNETLVTVTVTAVDGADNESIVSDPCEVGLYFTDPFTNPVPSLSHSQIGLGFTVDMTATTRNVGPEVDDVWATVPTEPSRLDLTRVATTSDKATWITDWNIPTTPGDIEGFRVVRFDAEDVAQPLPNHGERFAQPYLDLVPPFVSLSRPPYEYIHQNDLYIPIEGRSEVLSTIAITVTPRQTGQPTLITQTNSSAVGNWYSSVTLPDEGIFDIQVRATDQIGNVGPAAASVVIIDSGPPTVTVTARREGYTSIVAEWQGADTGSGIRSYDVQYAVDTPNNWQDWLLDTTQTQTSIGGEFGRSYYFRVQARDRAGNEGNWVQVGPISVELGEAKKYYSFGGSRIAMRDGDEVYYLSGDHLGSVSLTTDSSGAIVAESRYLPYGEVWWSNGTLPTDFGYTSQRSEGFQLLDYNARFYSPVLGRFISPDSIIPEPGSSQGWNRYAYVSNNPLKYVDPSGHDGEPWWERFKEITTIGIGLGFNYSYQQRVHDAFMTAYNDKGLIDGIIAVADETIIIDDYGKFLRNDNEGSSFSLVRALNLQSGQSGLGYTKESITDGISTPEGYSGAGHIELFAATGASRVSSLEGSAYVCTGEFQADLFGQLGIFAQVTEARDPINTGEKFIDPISGQPVTIYSAGFNLGLNAIPYGAEGEVMISQPQDNYTNYFLVLPPDGVLDFAEGFRDKLYD